MPHTQPQFIYSDREVESARAAAIAIADANMAFEPTTAEPGICRGTITATVDGRDFDIDVSFKLDNAEDPADLIAALRHAATDALMFGDLTLDEYFECRNDRSRFEPAKLTQIVSDHHDIMLAKSFLEVCHIGEDSLGIVQSALNNLPELVEMKLEELAEDRGETRVVEKTIREKLHQLGIFNQSHVAYSMALDYAREYLRLEKQVAASFDVVSGGAGTWKALPASERSDYLMQAAAEHARADWDLLDDKFASRMDDSIADMARKHEGRIADRTEAAAEKQDAFDAALDDAEARAASETHPIDKDKARTERTGR